MACTPTDLANDSRCMCGLSFEQHLAIQTWLLCQIVLGGGGGGLGAVQVLVYTTTDPTTDGIFPSDQTRGAIAYKQDGGGSTFVWDTNLLVWV